MTLKNLNKITLDTLRWDSVCCRSNTLSLPTFFTPCGRKVGFLCKCLAASMGQCPQAFDPSCRPSHLQVTEETPPTPTQGARSNFRQSLAELQVLQWAVRLVNCCCSDCISMSSGYSDCDTWFPGAFCPPGRGETARPEVSFQTPPLFFFFFFSFSPLSGLAAHPTEFSSFPCLPLLPQGT